MKKSLLLAALLMMSICTFAQNYKIKGNIDHKTWNKSQSSVVTFDGIPKTLEEFKRAQAVLGLEPQGAVALQLMAMEMYRHDRQLGTECLTLVNTSTNLNSVISRLREILGNDANYARPYLVASFIKGATPDNGYNPRKPYQIEVRVNPVTPYQASNLLRGYVLYLQVYSNGYDTPWRGVEVVKQQGEQYYRISNCPSMYTQCKEISWETDAEFKGL